MIQVILRPKLYKFETCESFATDFSLGERDLILTNRYIFEPYFGHLSLNVKTIFQEDYGSGEPTDVMAESIIRDAAKTGCDRVIAVGGGTVIDIAKAVACADGSETMDELYGMAPNLIKRRELIILPTTCGTGSEVTNIAVFDRIRMGTKMGLVSPALYADEAVLVPELLESLPFGVFAASSIDALVHAVESALSPKATAYTKVFSYKAIEMIVEGYKKLRENGREVLKTLLEDFLIASNFAGIAFGTAGCGLIHAMAYPLGSECHVAHGESNYAVFIGVMRKYAVLRRDGEITALNEILSRLLDCEKPAVSDKLDELLRAILVRRPLHEYGASEEDLKKFARSVIDNQGRLLANAYVSVDYQLILDIYNDLY